MFKKKFKIYLYFFISLFFILFIPWIILFSSYESRDVSLIVKKHLSQSDGVVGFGLLNKEKQYKKKMYEYIEPSVVVLGSSRVNQIKGKFFSAKFYNLNRALDFNKGEVEKEFKFLVEKNKNLKVIILGLDYWYFNAFNCERKYENEIHLINVENNTIFESKFIPKQTLEIWKFIIQGKISPEIFFSNLFFPTSRYGLSALYSDKEGYLQDGSYKYLKIRKKSLRDKMFEKKRNENIAYQLSSSVHREYCNEFLKKLIIVKSYLKKNNINLILYLPPYPEFHKKNVNSKSNFYQRLLLELKKNDIKFIDFFINDWGNVDNEFIDWVHSGETISSRILYDISEEYPEISEYINIKKINQTLHECNDNYYCE